MILSGPYNTSMAPDAPITVEFFGMARRLAGCPSVRVSAATIAEALDGVARDCAGLAGLLDGGRLSSRYLVSVNAGPFLSDLETGLASGDRVLLLSADAGG